MDINTASRTIPDGAEYLQLLEEYEKYRTEAALFFYEPHEKQKQFHAAHNMERCACSANQSGKTHCAAAELVFHLTGYYPDWWVGRKFDGPTQWWVGSETSELTRDGAQVKLLGAANQWGTGLIPKNRLIMDGMKLARGTPNAVEIIQVKHASGGVSEIIMKAFADGREKWQAGTVHGVWLDEEPPEEIYNEAYVRIQKNRGMMLLTLTPLKGMTAVARKFLDPEERRKSDRFVVQWSLDDATFYTDEDRRRMIAGYAPHEREARAKGIPMLGAGKVFPIPEDWITIDDFPVPEHWPVIGGMDIGWNHPTAGVKLALDPEKKTIYLVADYRASETTPLLHAQALKAWGEDLPWAWPHDALQHDKGSGEQVASIYRKHGLKMLSEHAKFPDDRGNGVEAGLWAMLELMQTGQWKVFKSCGLWLEEFRMYHRRVKDGRVQIVKEREDVISASRYAFMMQRYARPKVRADQVVKRYEKKRNKWFGAGWMSS